MANNTLIQGAARVGRSTMPVDVGGAMAKGIGSGISDAVAKRKAEQKKLKGESDARVENYLNQIPMGEGIEKIPPAYRDTVNKFLIQGRNEYAELAKQMGDLNPQDDQYQANVMRMNQIKNSFVNLNKQFEQFVELKDNFLLDKSKGYISNGNKIEDVDFLSKATTDELEVGFTPEGNLVFNRDGYGIELSEMPKYFNKAKAIGPLVELNKSLYTSGTPMTGGYEKATRYQVTSLIREGGREAVLSLATDDDIFEGGLGITDEDLLTNPERADELEKLVIDSWMEMLKSSAQEGYNLKQREASTKQQRELDKIKARGTNSGGSKPNFADSNFYDPEEEEDTTNIEDIPGYGVLQNINQ
jgi:hypothetical protein